jgi:hypothetical protein
MAQIADTVELRLLDAKLAKHLRRTLAEGFTLCEIAQEWEVSTEELAKLL